ncbi:acetyl-CoA carboxylase biotin carboxylase subunit [bacterium]|nr:acetyl-CoA carboxylase biotin carboxylase subunit [bacterium]
MFQKVLIANRGEIACRVIRGCRELGCRTVAVHSEPDAKALHVRLADEAFLLGAAAPAVSYLNQEKLLAVAREAGCDAVHPGYGFLAENAGFAEAVSAAGLSWIGPPPAAIRGMGLKIEARETARQAGAPVVPGFESRDAGDEEFLAAADEMGYPVMVKASAGGGGKGMRTVAEPAKLIGAIEAARRESAGAFGDSTVYLEKLIDRPRHIEIQVLADAHGHCVHLGERECSIQRRHQKVVEETPSTAVSAELRARMGADAVSIAQRVGYVGAGTVEFMLDPAGNYYFLEMNTRLQVEHPVTEYVYGVDLVHWQLQIAAGERLTLRQAELTPRGHSIECRVCAEDAAANFLPQIGRVEVYSEPTGPGVRLDTMLYPGWEVGADYDPLLGKLIVWGADRAAAIRRMAQALCDYRVLGVTTNLPFLHDVITHREFAAGNTTTAFIGENYPEWRAPEAGVPAQLAAALGLATARPALAAMVTGGNGELPTPWQSKGAWSNV